jgi:hypothetical protein
MQLGERSRRARRLILGGGFCAAVASLGAVFPAVHTIWDVSVMRRSLELGPLREARRLSPPVESPQRVLAEMAIDPGVRASAAVYQAGLLRGGAPGGRLPVVLGPGGAQHDRIMQAVAIVDRLLAPSQDPSRSSSSRSEGLQAMIGSAAALAGVDRRFLLRTADRESGLDPYARADHTSARGLFQFVDQTWLSSVARWGPRHGLGQEARRIRFDARGRAYVPDPTSERAILALRYDPRLAARLAAEMAASNAYLLSQGLGRAPSGGELYAAHLLGPAGALRLIRAAYLRPSYPAAWLLPDAAAKNRGLFYRRGAPRSASELLLSLS